MVNLERSLDHDGDPLAITTADAVAASGVPPWNWRETPGNGGEGNSAYGGRVIAMKWGEYTRRIGIDGTTDAIKEAIKSAFCLRTKRAFWLEDEDNVILSLDRDMPLGNYTLHLDEDMSCFQGLFFCPEAASLLLHNFCIYHISPPGHELGAATICPDDPVPSVDDLADQIIEVLNHFRLGAVMCIGVTAGAYILTLFAMKYRERVLGLILVSPLCKNASWTEWLYNKVTSNLLYFYGMCGLVKDFLLQRYFSKEVRGSIDVPESDIVQACRRLLDERQSINVLRFLQAIDRRPDITDGLKRLKCRTLIFVGEDSPFHSEAVHMTSKLDRRYSALVEVQACGSVVTEEQPHAMLVPMEYFFMGYGLYRPCQLSGSPRSPLSPSCISPDLLSPESMGLKLKPIKTRVSSHVNNSTDR